MARRRDKDHADSNHNNNDNKDDKDIKIMFNVLMYHLLHYQCDTKLEKQKIEFQRTVVMVDDMDDIMGASGNRNETTGDTIVEEEV